MKMHKRITALALAVVWTFFSPSWSETGWAQTTDDYNMVTPSQSRVTQQGLLPSEKIGIKPQVGLMLFGDQNANSAARATYGFTADWNAAPLINPSWTRYYGGPSLGFFFSHLGAPSSNFFGSNPDTNNGTGGANTLLFPVNLKIGYDFTDKIRGSIHGGGNIIFRSIASSIFVGDSSSLPGSVWRIYPNVGLDGEFSVDKNLAVIVRPDLTFTPGDEIFTATVGINLLLG
jgi:hypothetical protein